MGYSIYLFKLSLRASFEDQRGRAGAAPPCWQGGLHVFSSTFQQDRCCVWRWWYLRAWAHPAPPKVVLSRADSVWVPRVCGRPQGLVQRRAVERQTPTTRCHPTWAWEPEQGDYTEILTSRRTDSDKSPEPQTPTCTAKVPPCVCEPDCPAWNWNWSRTWTERTTIAT